MQKQLHVFTLFLILVLGIGACHKGNTNTAVVPAKFTGCRIAQIIKSTSADTSDKIVSTFYYNNDGTIARIYTLPGSSVNNSHNVYFLYEKGYMLANTAFYGESTPSGLDSIILDTQGRVIAIYYNDNQGGAHNQVWNNYQYNSMGEVMLVTMHNYGVTSTENFQWQNGDIEWNTAGTDVYHYVYDSVVYNVGNINAGINDLLSYGIGVYAPKHLYSQIIQDNTDTINYTYTLDTTGKLTYIKEVQPDNFVNYTWITYDCE